LDLGRLREQRQHGQTNQERIGGRPAHQPECHTQRSPLRLGKPVRGGQELDQQLVNGGPTHGLSDSTAAIRTIWRSAARSTA
jgi:hypothetical protein